MFTHPITTVSQQLLLNPNTVSERTCHKSSPLDFHNSDENESAPSALAAAARVWLANDFWDVTLACEDDSQEGCGAQLCGRVPRRLGCGGKGNTFSKHSGWGHHHCFLPPPLWSPRGSPPPSPCSYWPCSPASASSPPSPWPGQEGARPSTGCPPPGCPGWCSTCLPSPSCNSCSPLNP